MAALLLAGLVPVLGGCVPLLVGGVAVGAAAAHDRRDYTTFIDDQQIDFVATAALDDEPGLKGRGRVSVTSYNYLVLLTGQVRSEAEVALAGGVVSRLPKVRKVVNEVTIGPDIDFARKSEDVLLTSRAKLALFKVEVPDFDPTRVTVVTENGVVYLLGLVSVAEGDAAVEQVRYVPGVVQVVKLFEYQEPKT
ncbi:BON domain-containing protein [Candidatus Thiodictyon syntrophicum]|jgi:osmotically-inducible protein OsmY|uniref:Transporter n=1 Tax=Candidatus Thiodictyon syntrophicum TaxID=1166950 RepID=A0A2K8U2I4_9GAMM|nr:BON domain-containing protein [Candidatus Thiodictyon syntrophicum]AUB79757.1 transporter [Candidatus Thiodictyon syntrophicum]